MILGGESLNRKDNIIQLTMTESEINELKKRHITCQDGPWCNQKVHDAAELLVISAATGHRPTPIEVAAQLQVKPKFWQKLVTAVREHLNSKLVVAQTGLKGPRKYEIEGINMIEK